MPRDSKAHPPFCDKCGGHHWRFIRCENAEAFAARSTENKIRRTPEIVRAPREDGLKDWGDRLTTLTRLGGRTFGNAARTTPIQTGSISHPDWQPPE